MTFHFYSLDAKKDVPVSLGNGGGGIGLWFGETNGPERVFSFTGTNICISFDGTEPRIQLRRNIDLSPRRYLSEEHLFFDENGAVTNHDVFPR